MNREYSGTRDLTYSNWHRKDNIARYLGNDERKAHCVSVINIDSLEYCLFCKRPLALIEDCRGNAGSAKQWECTRKLAEAARIPAYLLIYEPTGELNGKLQDGGQYQTRDISRMWIEQVHGDRKEITPEAYALFLFTLHMDCGCEGSRTARKTLGIP